MKYEICKGIKDEDDVIWSAIAWTDVGAYADIIVTALRLMTGRDYAIRIVETPAAGTARESKVTTNILHPYYGRFEEESQDDDENQ